MLEAFLDYYRSAVRRKMWGLSEEDARRRLVPSATTLGGIVKHLRLVELNWFQRTLAQLPDSVLPPVHGTTRTPVSGWSGARRPAIAAVAVGVTADEQHRLDREHQSRLRPEAASGTAFVGNVRLFVHRATDAVSAVVGQQPELRRTCGGPDRVRDIAERAAGGLGWHAQRRR